MQQRYNIVLIPSLIKDREKFINFAQQFATEHLIELQGYLLGTNSIPHITLCQFEGSEKELEKIKNALQTLVCSDEGYAPNFNIFNGKIILGGNLAGKEAVDLGVEKTSEIVRLHTEINNIVKKIGLTPLNASGDLYRPHLTLAFFKPQEVPVPETISLEQFNGINFTVALGKADDNWQFTEILTTQKDLSLSTANILVKYFGYTQKQAEDFLDVSIKMQVGLDPFLKGEVFNGKYSLEEQESICREMVVIVQDQFAKKTTTAEKFYTSSAGAPGTGKTFFLETKCNAVDPQSNVIYVDPDRSTLPKLSMYTQYCKEKGFKDAYNKCRDGSNYMANFMLIKAIMEGLNIIHGTTASSEIPSQLSITFK